MRQDIKKQVQRRLKIIAGQVKGLQKMIEEEQYCIDVITQSAAVRAALGGVEDLMLENHFSSHVVEQMKSGDEDRAVKEMLKIYKKIR